MHIFIKTFTVLTLFILILTISCSSHKRRGAISPEEDFHRAMEKFNRGKYLDAMEALTIITLNYSGSSIIDSAQYYLGESHYRMKEYIIAASEFQRLVNQYPSSPLVDEAKYKVGMSYLKLSPGYGLDQEFTYKCVDEFQEFTECFPESDLVPEVMEMIYMARSKIAMKIFKSGEPYFKMRDYESALIYFKSVLDYYYDTDHAPASLLLMGESYFKMKQPVEGELALLRLVEKYPDSSEAEKASVLLHPEQVGGEFP